MLPEKGSSTQQEKQEPICPLNNPIRNEEKCHSLLTTNDGILKCLDVAVYFKQAGEEVLCKASPPTHGLSFLKTVPKLSSWTDGPKEINLL